MESSRLQVRYENTPSLIETSKLLADGRNAVDPVTRGLLYQGFSRD